MIQKRFKQTESLAQAQVLKALIESQEVILAKIDLPDITINGVEHSQTLLVRNLNVAISVNYIKISPERFLTDKVTDKEVKGLNLYVPDWTITSDNLSSHIGADGQRIMYAMEYFNDETEEVVTEDEEGNALPILEPEAFLMPTIPYLMFFAKQIVLPELLQTFSHQFVADNIDVWTVIDNPTLARPV